MAAAISEHVAFEAGVVPALKAPISQAVWYQIYDGRRIRAGDVPSLMQQILGLLRRVALEQGTAVLVASHDPAATALADRIYRLEDGRLIGPARH